MSMCTSGQPPSSTSSCRRDICFSPNCYAQASCHRIDISRRPEPAHQRRAITPNHTADPNRLSPLAAQHSVQSRFPPPTKLPSSTTPRAAPIECNDDDEGLVNTGYRHQHATLFFRTLTTSSSYVLQQHHHSLRGPRPRAAMRLWPHLGRLVLIASRRGG